MRTAQYLLTARGHRVTAGGVFGGNTAQAVKAFQRTNRLSADGVIGATTWNNLKHWLSPGRPPRLTIGPSSGAGAVQQVRMDAPLLELSDDPEDEDRMSGGMTDAEADTLAYLTAAETGAAIRKLTAPATHPPARRFRRPALHRPVPDRDRWPARHPRLARPPARHRLTPHRQRNHPPRTVLHRPHLVPLRTPDLRHHHPHPLLRRPRQRRDTRDGVAPRRRHPPPHSARPAERQPSPRALANRPGRFPCACERRARERYGSRARPIASDGC
ncbi:peptidoglycan-binding protein [Streptomyces sp. NPDC048330]|uniref:peptidoglycan-binding domain-containing protein n=1 Tax=Streptomyces sp. NPDC048330 TaxID=3365533 RepID=UPI003720A834